MYTVRPSYFGQQTTSTMQPSAAPDAGRYAEQAMSDSSLIPATSLSSPTSFRDLAGMSLTPRTSESHKAVFWLLWM